MSGHYTGDLDLHSLRHGKGEYKYPNAVFRFNGGWRAGMKNGQGVFAVEGISTFEGNFIDGEIEGRGSKHWADGRRYDGEFKRGEACGEGRFTSPTGESYIGAWVKNRRHGRGQLVLPGGQGTYAGEFEKHRYHGEGQLLLASGFQYSGAFVEGLPHGIGAAVHPGGSTFNGPFERGLRNGHGGKYVCGITGICWVGEWEAGRTVAPPSKWAIEQDNTDRALTVGGQGVDRPKGPKSGAKIEKGSGGRKGVKGPTKDVVGPERSDAEKSAIAYFDGDGVVSGLWCRCVRDVQEQNERGPELPEIKGETDGSTRVVRDPQRAVVSDESGRTLAVSLHEVADTPPGSIGEPVTFFVQRPDATDVSESLGRFTEDGLVAFFQRDKQCFPKGKSSFVEKLTIVPGEKSAPVVPFEQSAPEPPAKGGKVSPMKSKGGSKGEVEQSPPEEGGVDPRWRAIKSEVQSNHCLVIGAGENFTLATPPLFSEPWGTKVERGGQRRPSNLGDEGNARPPDGNILPELGKTAEKSISGVVYDGTYTMDARNHYEPTAGIRESSPYTVCIDFRIDLVESLLSIEDGQKMLSGEIGDVIDREGHVSAGDKAIRILSCGNDVQVFAVIRLWVPVETPGRHFQEGSSTEGSKSDPTRAVAGTVVSSGGALPPGTSAGDGARKVPTLSTPLSPQIDDNGPAAPTTPTWYLHAITVRSKSYAGTVTCMDPAESAMKRRHDLGDVVESSAQKRQQNLGPEEACVTYELAEWHALAVIADENGGGDAPISLCIDGDMLKLRHDMHGVVNALSTSAEGRDVSTSRAVVMGGPGGEWAVLAVKNLALYNRRLCSEELLAATQVFRAWREEQQAAEAADAQEDERWLEETRRAEEDGRQPHERQERPVGADPTCAVVRKTVRGEAKIDKIVLPKAALEGQDWVLRVKDVSHGQNDDQHAWPSRATEAKQALADEEAEVFPPLPLEIIWLKRLPLD